MDLRSDDPFWIAQNPHAPTYPPLSNDERCDVLIVGAGISGAMLADRLSGMGMNVVVLDRREAGHGSTAASTAILQYEIDVHLTELTDLIGPAGAARAYHLCYEAIDKLEQLAAGLPHSGFARKLSLYVASRERDVPALRDEYEARRECGFNVELVEGDAVHERFSLPHPAALVSTQAAVCDSYRMAHSLLARATANGARVHGVTEVLEIACENEDTTANTDRGFSVRARNVIFATGYESEKYLKTRVADLQSTYAFASQQLEDFKPWSRDRVLWESARPYLYLRPTTDGRLMAGGLDDPFRNAEARDGLTLRRAKQIRKQVAKLLPHLDLEIEYAWSGTFGETRDGLPYIGAEPERPHVQFAIGYGGNGMIFSQLATDILADILTGKPNADALLFRFGR